MLKRTELALNLVDLETRAALMNKLGLKDTPRTPLYTVLTASLVMHIHVVMACLRLNTKRTLDLATALVGRPINVCKPDLARARLSPFLAAAAAKTVDQRRVLAIKPRPGTGDTERRLLSTDLYRRLGLIRVGMTVEQLMVRGVTRRDLRLARARGWLKIEETVD